MFGFPDVTNFPGVPPIAGLSGLLGEQVRGFGFLSAGDFDTIVRFHNVFSFDRDFPFGPNPGGFADGEAGNANGDRWSSFSSPSTAITHPIVSQQATLAATSPANVHAD